MTPPDGYTYPPELLPSPDEGDDVEIIINGMAWKLVPVEPTEEMLRAGQVRPGPAAVYLTCSSLITRWKAMLDAAPQPQQEGKE